MLGLGSCVCFIPLTFKYLLVSILAEIEYSHGLPHSFLQTQQSIACIVAMYFSNIEDTNPLVL